MTIENEAPPQEESSEVAGATATDQSGADKPQTEGKPDVTPSESAPGVEQVKAVEPSREQLVAKAEEAERRSVASDTEATRYREQIARETLTRQTEQREATEHTARSVDAKSVEDGDLTASEALTRSETRQAAVARTDAAAQRTEDYESVITTMISGAEKVGRESFAAEFAEEFGVDKAALMDPTIRDEHEMKLKARELRVERQEQERTGTETFDGGGATGTAPPSTDGMHGIELATAAYSPEAIKERAKNRG